MSKTVKSIPLESIDPKSSCISFGCVSVGFTYHLSLTFVNNQLFSQRYKFIISSDLSKTSKYNQNISNSALGTDVSQNNEAKILSQTKLIAPGMQIDFVIEFSGYVEKYSKFSLTILQSGVPDSIIYNIKALVVSPDVYRSFRRANRLDGKDMSVPGLSVSRAISCYDENKSILSSVSSVNSQAFTDEDEIEELIDYPIVSNCYWDPFTKTLKMDDQLTQACIDPAISAEGCMQKTMELRNERYRELEDQGYYTSRLIDGLRNIYSLSNNNHSR